jgi:predicted DNA-binding protein (MmcQ/YjbR family)
MAAKKKKTSAKDASKRIREFALSLPGAWEDFPWGERVVKVGKKVFVFLGKSFSGFGLSVKLPKSKKQALALDFCEPTGYGLGKSGWVSAQFAPKSKPPTDMLIAWIEESYRAVAPKKLIKELDERSE